MRPQNLAAAVALAALVLPTSGADANRATKKAETCAGATPTAVTTSPDGATIYGTEGDDVIFVTTDLANDEDAHARLKVSAYGGDDFICLKGNHPNVDIFSGDGVDYVNI